MSETTPDPLPPNPETDPPAEPAAPLAPSAETVRRPAPIGGILGAIVILILLAAGGGYYLWHQEIVGQKQQTAALNGEINGLKARLAQLGAQVAAVKTPPPVQIPTALTDRIDGLQQKVKTLDARLASQSDASAQQQSQVQPHLDALGTQLGKLQTHVGTLDSNLGDLQPRMSALDSKLGDLQSRMSGFDSKLGDLQTKVGNSDRLAAKAQHLDRLAMASLALQSGQSLGTIENAPPALSRYAQTAPPTEAELRQEFPAAAARAVDAGGEVQSTDKGYWQRLKMRVAGLVTLRHGDQVLVGSEVSGVIAAAQADLDAGNLQKAVDTLQALSPQAKTAMQDWLNQAKDLIAARQALAGMAEHKS